MVQSKRTPTMPDPKNLPTALSPAEWEIMKVFWDLGPMAARDVYAALPRDCSWAYKTVKTLLSRLVAKEALAYDQIGNSYLYRPAVDISITRPNSSFKVGQVKPAEISVWHAARAVFEFVFITKSSEALFNELYDDTVPVPN